jgi:hypothetical protein
LQLSLPPSVRLFLESPPQLDGNLLKTLLAVRPLVHVCIASPSTVRREEAVAGGAAEVINTPRLVQHRHLFSATWLVAVETHLTKQSLVVPLAVSHALLLVVSATFKRLLAVGTHEMLRMPGLVESMDKTAFNRSPAGSTYCRHHVVIAT